MNSLVDNSLLCLKLFKLVTWLNEIYASAAIPFLLRYIQ